ncbi:glutathione S-transferase 1-like [Daphnia carinata]|uniref:glutathione S-transferase 1-like n=1 Tax=Daphnia carinata TaxID=120202 RepID=UPI00257BE60F|nr:glutathione S-transferase 1-like [Daphnia carinata]
MPIDLYYMSLSGPCRAVMLTAKMVGVELNLKIVNLMAGEQMKPEFLKINPQHTVPTLVDSGFVLTESRAICAYLVNKYGKDDKLYPKSPKDRAVVDQRLFFDLGVFYSAFSDYYYPVIFRGATSLDDGKKKKLDEALRFFNMFVSDRDFAAGDHLTIADLSLVASASTMERVNPKIFDDYPKIKEWMERCKNQIPDYHDLNQVGAEIFGQIGQSALAKIQ